MVRRSLVTARSFVRSEIGICRIGRMSAAIILVFQSCEPDASPARAIVLTHS
jgi:hypothetical protein